MESIISKLHPLERSVLPVLLKEKEISAIAKLSNLQEIEVMRALQWLENKNVLKINVDKKKIVDLEENGIKYKKEGLPEKRLLQSLTEEFQSLGEIAKKTRLSTEELNACIGILRRKVAIEIDKGKDLMLKLGPQGKKLLKDGS